MAVARPTVAPNVAQVLALQRSAGNASVARMLARTPDPATVPAFNGAVQAQDWSGAVRALAELDAADRRELLVPLSPLARQALRDAAIQSAPEIAGEIEALEHGAPDQAAPANDVAAMSGIQRLGKAWEYAKEDLKGAVTAELAALFSPASLATMLAFAALFVLAQATPAGWVADGLALATLTISAIFLGGIVFDVTRDLVAFVGAASATTDQDLRSAGAALARAIARGGVALVVALFAKALKGPKGGRPMSGPPEATAPFEAVTPEGLVIRMPVRAAQQVVAANPSAIQQIAAMSVLAPPPGGRGGGPQESSGGGSGEGAKTGPAIPEDAVQRTTPMLRGMGVEEPRIAAFFKGDAVAYLTPEGVISILQIVAGRLRAGIFSINVENDPSAAVRAFARFRGPARSLASALGLSEMELFGAAVKNPKVEAMLRRQGFQPSTEPVPETMGLGPSTSVEIWSKRFAVTASEAAPAAGE